MKKKGNSNRIYWIIALAVIVLGAGGFSAYRYWYLPSQDVVSEEATVKTYSHLEYRIRNTFKYGIRDFVEMCKFKLTGVDKTPPESRPDTIDRSSCLDDSSSEYEPKWIINITSGNISLTGTSGTLWTILEGLPPSDFF